MEIRRVARGASKDARQQNYGRKRKDGRKEEEEKEEKEKEREGGKFCGDGRSREKGLVV